ncbi:early transcribed membrane protein [Plasmodium gallinaceum]|uniref:Early transcribed membrane protein n=1 Tax=Plasmodium gallinaceum TaxID=5849 RepID=A0A1J1GRY1_PLAGA|nr:early transcribed membrane protein [Plasmodium gallinaceum]CRG94064.1 early transcribed membrane protein [Plasmodium gallinaceum]
MKISKTFYFLSFLIVINLLKVCLSSYPEDNLIYNGNSLRNVASSLNNEDDSSSLNSFDGTRSESSSGSRSISYETESVSSGYSASTEEPESELSSGRTTPYMDFKEPKYVSKGERYFRYPRCEIPANLKAFEEFMTEKIKKQYNDTREDLRLYIRDPDYIRGKIYHSASKYNIIITPIILDTLVKKIYIKLIEN